MNALSLIDAFKAEAATHLDEAERCLMLIGTSDDALAANIDEIFRSIHSIKGSAGYVGHTAVLDLAHAFESTLDLFRSRPGTTPDELQMDVFCQTLTLLRDLVDRAETSLNDDMSGPTQELTHILSALTYNELTPVAPRPRDDGDAFRNCTEQQLIAINASLTVIGIGLAVPAETMAMLLRAAETLIQAASYMGHESVEVAARRIADWALSHDSAKLMQPDVEALSQAVVALALQIRTLFTPGKAPAAVTSAKAAPPRTNLVRIERAHVDVLMDLVGELIVTRNNFEHLFTELSGSAKKREGALKELKSSHATLRQISERIQDGIMAMKLIPLDDLFQKIPKLARDLSRSLNKKVEVVIEGGATSVDRGVADELADPLLHLVRNAVDHGIEGAEQRRLAGKPERARIILRAHQDHQNIVIEVVDDGGGIDTARVRMKAVSLGLISPEVASALTEQQSLELIFRAGFSTAAQVSAVSGRGVGLDVVKINIGKLGGNISVQTEPGHGTTMRIVVPLTMTILNAILVYSNHQLYAFPVNTVDEVVRVPRDQVYRVATGEAMMIRDEVLALRRLDEILEQRSRLDQVVADALTVLIVSTAKGRLGIAVTSIHCKEEIVVKPLHGGITTCAAIKGAAVLGDGSAILILDPNGLIGLNSCRSLGGPSIEGVSDA